MNFILPRADAVEVAGWDEHDGQVSRYFRGTERGIEVRVDLAGSQNDAGSTTSTRWPLGRNWPSCHSKVITAGTLRPRTNY